MSTALYRRYRPDRFEEVIGQDHVTVPLRTALSKDRVNHAYLFSGPRGCGKTTSARILARCLNCAQGPTATPCGQCDSCRDLATGGPGSLDVMEIDAASHGGVEDARGLRERATFAPVRDRYKILIIDEAHMVTAAGFNALLKIVEEPPEHLKFIFATTEPDKVIGTIRSRTHHYPFRLVPPEPLIAYMEQLCASESTQVDPGVLPLVVRAGTGSVRDTLSVLDQLIAGAAEGRVDYDLAVNLLGFTPGALLDDVIDAVAADDPPTVFHVVDRVVQSGQDPRRFVEDLLDRFRDLVIARAMPDQASVVLHGVPDDQVRRLTAQAAQLSRAELSRLADVTNEALSEMVGATSPKLHLELLMARLLLPAADETQRGLAARLEALERRIDAGLIGTTAEGSAATPPRSRTPGAATEQRDGPSPVDDRAGGQNGPTDGELSGAALARAAMRRTSAGPAPEDPAPEDQEHAEQPPAESTSGTPDGPTNEPTDGPTAESASGPTDEPAVESAPGPTTEPEPSPASPATQAPAPQTPAAAQAPAPEIPGAAQPAAAQSASQVEKMRRAWPDVLTALEDSSRLVWMLVKDNASVVGFDGSLLTIGFTQDAPRQSLLGRQGDRLLAEAVHQVLGIRPELDLILGADAPRPGAAPGPDGGTRPKAEGRPGQEAAAPSVPRAAQPDPQPEPAPTPDSPAPASPASPADASEPASGPDPSPTPVSTESAPSAAPSPDSWGTPADVAPDWGMPDGGGDPDPWAHLPEYDPDSDMEDSPGPDGWQPGPDEDTTDDTATAPAPAPAPPTADHAASGPDAPSQEPAWQVPTAEQWRPGPLVPEADEPAIPSFARPEAELRAEFAARFGSTRPEGFGTASSSTDAAEDAATAPASPESSRPAESAAPAPDAQDGADSDTSPAPAGGNAPEERNDPAALVALGSGHPASQFPALMRRISDGGGAEPPVNAGGPHPSDPATGGRPEPSTLAASRDATGDRAGGAPTPPPLDPRAASIQAAREAARGRGPATLRTATGGPGRPADASAASVDWEDEVASDEDLTLEDSGLVGRAVVERLLGATLLEEIPND